MNCIGNYTLERLIGQGGNGVVYRSTHPVLGRPVAVKALHKKLSRDPELRERFLHEARMTLDLNHPRIVNVYDVDQDGTRAFMVMEWFARGSLADVLAHQRLELPAVLALAAQVAEALAFAHSQGVVHGDIKPSNVLVRGDGTPVVADFGLAADYLAPSTGAAPGQQVRGTPAYMAPEQIRGAATDARTDAYAFGTMLYELVSGRPPFDGALALLLHRQLTAAPVALHARNPSVPDALEALVEQLLAKDPAERPAGMAEIAAQLHAISNTPALIDAAPSVPLTPQHAPTPPRAAAEPHAQPLAVSSDALTMPVSASQLRNVPEAPPAPNAQRGSRKR